MTFIAPTRSAEIDRMFAFGRRDAKVKTSRRIVDEEGARRAVGADDSFPAAAIAGSSIEHLARIALG